MFSKMNRRCVLLDHSGGILLDKVTDLSPKDILFTSTLLTAEIKTTVGKIDRLRTDIDAIVAEIEA